MKTLLQIADEHLAFAALIEEADSELTPEIESALDTWFSEIGAEKQQKVDNYCALVRTMELRAACRKEEMERLARRVQVDTNNAKRLKDRLKLFMELTGERKIETDRYSVRVQNNGGKVPMEISVQPDRLPPECQRMKIEADTDKIREMLESGAVIDGCTLGVRGTQIRIA